MNSTWTLTTASSNSTFPLVTAVLKKNFLKLKLISFSQQKLWTFLRQQTLKPIGKEETISYHRCSWLFILVFFFSF